MQKEILKQGINLYMIKDNKFKSQRASVLIHRPLDKKEVTLNTLLVAVMRMQSKNYPTFSDISKELENLYGADIIARAGKYGERQIVKFGVRSVCGDALGKSDIFENAMNLLYDIAFLAGTGKGFSEDIVELEKKNITNSILSQKNDKRSYSVLRLQEVMCEDEPYGINPMGYVEELEKITAEELYNHYKKIMKESRIDIIFTGNFKESDAKNTAEKFIFGLSEREGAKMQEITVKEVKEIKTVTDKMDVTQGKLCMGWRAGTDTAKENYPATIVYNSIFGGSAVSKLFNNVREKLSLCYYVGSSIDRLKEIMIVSSGVEFENFQKAYDEIMLQQSLMEKGEFSDEEISFAKKQLKRAYEANLDSINAMEEYYTMQILLGIDISIDKMTEEIEKVTREDIINAAKGMMLDTVYYLEKE